MVGRGGRVHRKPCENLLSGGSNMDNGFRIICNLTAKVAVPTRLAAGRGPSSFWLSFRLAV